MARRPPDRILLRMLGARIRGLREDRGWSQEELGRRAGQDRTAIQKYEAGETEPLLSSILLVAHALGKEPNDLLTGDAWDRIKAGADARGISES